MDRLSRPPAATASQPRTELLAERGRTCPHPCPDPPSVRRERAISPVTRRLAQLGQDDAPSGRAGGPQVQLTPRRRDPTGQRFRAAALIVRMAEVVAAPSRS